MAKKPGGGGGGGDDRKRSIKNTVLEGFSVLGAEVAVGQALAAGVRVLISKCFAERSAEADKPTIDKVKEEGLSFVKKNTKNPKLHKLYEKYVSDMIDIHASPRSDVEKEAAARQLLKDYKAEVNLVKLEEFEGGLRGVLLKLEPAQARTFIVWLNARRLKLRGKRVFLFTPAAAACFVATGWPPITSLQFEGVTYQFSVAEATNFQCWLVANYPLPLAADLVVDGEVIMGLINPYRLTKAQRQEVLFRKDQINDAELVRRMLDCSDDATARFEYLMSALPKKPIKDQVAGVAEAVLTGRAGSHPLVQSFERAAKANAAEQIAALQASRANYKKRRGL